jgi:hypothetical protein
MSGPTITYAPRSDAGAEAELSVLSNVYRFVLGSRAKREAAPESRPKDARERINDARTHTHCT